MRRTLSALLCAAVLALTACGGQTAPAPQPQPDPVPGKWEGAAFIDLSDGEIAITLGESTTKVSNVSKGQEVSCNGETGKSVITVAKDIVYYEAGQDFTYGEGSEVDAHTPEEADAHTVITIRQPGTYVLRGQLSAGQVAVDLGEDAEEDPEAVVTLVLDQVDITCTVAPAVIFYNVYECGDKDAPTKDVDTTAAGANVIIAGGTENNISGSYVARIYKPGTVELSEDGTEVEKAKKLHKYDGAFYSKMSMNISCDDGNSGRLFIRGENEGLDSEMHLTINGGTIDIRSGNDGINTNEDDISVTTVNGGALFIQVTGETGEGDGIDSNGWVVINGGSVFAQACETSMDSGLDSDKGICINGGIVLATGNMLDMIEPDGQTYAVFQFAQSHRGEERITLKDAKGGEVLGYEGKNDYSVMVYSNPNLAPGDYTLWSGDTQLGHSGSQGGMMGGRPGGIEPGGPKVPEEWEDIDFSELPKFPAEPEEMEFPEDFAPENRPPRPEPPGGMEPGKGPAGFDPDSVSAPAAEAVFTMRGSENYFSGVGALSE